MTVQNISEVLTNRLIPVKKWNDHFEWPPIGGLRHIIFHADTNGFSPAIKRVGRRVLIDHEKFWKIVDEQNSVKT
ncbi:MAG: hypothetical protein KZQ98_19770 [Candidatus Thiodiazotropha sp. (ex Lucinoma borealis)]|nr:hypothetical protein [Candidatus Thiodiazotropha sp. (ex Lucinoma borealis)]